MNRRDANNARCYGMQLILRRRSISIFTTRLSLRFTLCPRMIDSRRDSDQGHSASAERACDVRCRYIVSAAIQSIVVVESRAPHVYCRAMARGRTHLRGRDMFCHSAKSNQERCLSEHCLSANFRVLERKIQVHAGYHTSRASQSAQAIQNELRMLGHPSTSAEEKSKYTVLCPLGTDATINHRHAANFQKG